MEKPFVGYVVYAGAKMVDGDEDPYVSVHRTLAEAEEDLRGQASSAASDGDEPEEKIADDKVVETLEKHCYRIVLFKIRMTSYGEQISQVIKPFKHPENPEAAADKLRLTPEMLLDR